MRKLVAFITLALASAAQAQSFGDLVTCDAVGQDAAIIVQLRNQGYGKGKVLSAFADEYGDGDRYEAAKVIANGMFSADGRKRFPDPETAKSVGMNNCLAAAKSRAQGAQ
ncbi:TPA: hypothetical protein ACT5B2_000141 [Burkholderia cenocepacia]